MPLAAKRGQLKGTHHVAVAAKTAPALSSCVSKSQLRDPSLNVGVGAGALYMLITCHEEMRKLNKTLQETENLVQELRQQLQYHHEDSGSHQAHSVKDKSSPTQNLQADIHCTGQPNVYSSRTCSLDDLSEEQMPAARGMAKDQMADLAAELEAELELMELNMKAEETHPFETFTHDGGEVSSKGFTNSYYSDTSSHGIPDVSDIGRSSAHLEACQMDYGVSAIELDHRLREVLEAQQEERILELEQLLKETKAKLLAKENEICSWKNHVSSLTNLLQPPSTSGTQLLRLNKPNGSESVTMYDNLVGAVPEVTKSTVELLHSFQDPPISTHVNYVEASNTTDFLADVLKQETKPQSSSVHGLRNEKCSLSKASVSAPPIFTSSKDPVDMAGKPDSYQGTGIAMPKYVVMKEFVNAEGDDILLDRPELEISRLHHIKCKLENCGGYMDEDDTASGRTEMEVSALHYMKCRFGMDETSVSLDLLRTEKLERGSDDVKYMVNFGAPKGDEDCGSSGEEVMLMHAPKTNLKAKNQSLQQLLSKGLKVSYDGPVKVTSPVLDKIRHFEALGGRALEKRVC